MPIGPKFLLPKLKTGVGSGGTCSLPSAEQNQMKIKAKALTKLTPFRSLSALNVYSDKDYLMIDQSRDQDLY